MPNCNELMTTSLVTCEERINMVNIARRMDAANVGSLPVIESMESQKLVGIITDRDIVTRVVATNRNLSTTVSKDIMTTEIVTCRADDDLEHAIQKMATHQIRRIPIVDDDNRLVGIIAQADIARYMDERVTGIIVSKISEQLDEGQSEEIVRPPRI